MEKFLLIDGEKFYYEEIELYTGRKRINRIIAKENLKLFNSIIEATNITYGLIYGTLLGAIRENDFIEHDEDTDIFVLSEFKDDFLRLLYKFKNIGLEVVRSENDLISLMRNDEYIDVYFFYPIKKFGIKRIRVMKEKYEIKAKHLEKTTFTDFLGMKISIPSEPKKLLKKIYGRDWEIPILNKNAKPNSLMSNVIERIPIIRKIPYYSKLLAFYKELRNK